MPTIFSDRSSLPPVRRRSDTHPRKTTGRTACRQASVGQGPRPCAESRGRTALWRDSKGGALWHLSPVATAAGRKLFPEGKWFSCYRRQRSDRSGHEHSEHYFAITFPTAILHRGSRGRDTQHRYVRMAFAPGKPRPVQELTPCRSTFYIFYRCRRDSCRCARFSVQSDGRSLPLPAPPARQSVRSSAQAVAKSPAAES